jgi:hypothetical protein
MADLKSRALNMLIALDQCLFCLITLGNSHPDETISAAAWRWEADGHWRGRLLRPAIDFLFSPLEPDHCYASWLSEKNGGHLPPSYRDPPA